ncbi:MAG: imidazolonepropionase-like amidohydrolase [Arenicella sp.]|jgi:imidazolonepropionase-like amidohydrolase
MIKPTFVSAFVLTITLVSSFLAPSITAAQTGDVWVIHAGSVLVMPGKKPASSQSIVIRGKHIERIESGFIDPIDVAPTAKLIDLKDKFVLPGLMDMHVHLLGQLSKTSRTDMLFVTTSMDALTGAYYANTTLNAGFTTVRDLGGNPEAIYALRDAVNQGLVPGPRIFAAGSALAATGGHGDIDGVKPELLKLWTPETICDGPFECRKAARHAIKMGADWIKITATGGVLSDTATGTDQQMSNDELSEIVRTAHGLGVKVAAHAHGNNGIKAALRAGVDSIDHGTFSDKEAINLFKQSGAFLVPTLSPGVKVPAMMEGNPFFTDNIKDKAMAASAAAQETFLSAYKAGVKIAFGTDSSVTPHGENADEFVMMVRAGMSAADAIRSATIVSANLLGVEDKLGTLENGKLADIIAVSGNPLEDISRLRKVDFVMKAGKVMKSAQ